MTLGIQENNMNRAFKCFYSLCDSDDEVEKVAQMLGSIIETPEVEDCLKEIKEYDVCTYEHSREVALISLLIGLDLSLPMPGLKELGIGALLHDYGKIKIPLEIIRKPGKIDIVEREIIEAHPALGAYFLRKKGFSDGVISGVYEHHESYIGSERGYPRHLVKNEIHLNGRIISLADKVSAYCQKRVYHEERGISELKKFLFSCDDLDSELVCNLQKRIG